MIRYTMWMFGKYVYDHKVLLDYNCIVNANYQYSVNGSQIRGNANLDNAIKGYKDENGDVVAPTITNQNKQKAYLIAVAKERNNLYKPIEYETNYGYESIIGDNGENLRSDTKSTSINGAYKIEVVYAFNSESAKDLYNQYIYSTKMSLQVGNATGSSEDGSDYISIATSSTSNNTVTFYFNDSNPSGTISWNFGNGVSNGDVDIKGIKVYYK